MSTTSNSIKNVEQRKAQDIQTMGSIGRTQGDGMENVIPEKSEIKPTKCRLGDTLIYHPTNLKQPSSIPPVTPTGTIVNLVPKHISNVKNEKPILNSLKSKEPKFVPYEPYKAAVKPIIPYDKNSKQSNRNDLSMNMTISQLAALKICKPEVQLSTSANENEDTDNEWIKEKKAYDTEILKLKEENRQLENQLKFQAQVNGDLKNLLVAAMGEDLETRVHLLTEDKLQLARALLNSAQHLSTHQEQTEWLAGQCEVWRSKFLASSLMVEELAKWKAALCQRSTELQEAIKRLLEDRNLIRSTSLKMFKTLSILRESFDPVGAASYKKQELPSTNIIDLTQGCYQLAEILRIQLLSGMENTTLQKEIDTTSLEMKTVAEKTAEQLLMSPKLIMSGRQDVACSAVMGAAVAIGGQIFLPRNDSNMACCPHCSGEIKQI